MEPDELFAAIGLLLVLSAASWAVEAPGSKYGRDVRLVVPMGSTALLPCPVSGDPANFVFTWYTRDAALDCGSDPKVQVLASGALRISDTTTEDTGVYICRALSDAVTLQVNVTLTVLGDVQDETLIGDISVETENGTTIFPRRSRGVPPSLVASHEHLISNINRTAGGSVRFRCLATGQPRPQVSWFKDDVPLAEVDSTAIVKRGRWSLLLRNLTLVDSGNYTCLVRNLYGSVGASFLLTVNGKDRPDLAVFHPLNTTVKYGASATFQCRVRSEAPPNIQWLKRVEHDDGEEDEHTSDVIRVQDEYFRILKSSEVLEKPGGSFLNKLFIPRARERDSGKYICLGANTMGYSFRSAFLTVLPRPKTITLGWSRSVSIHPGNSSSLLVAIPVTLGVVVGVLVALVVLCHRRRFDTPIPSRPMYRRTDLHPETKSASEPDRAEAVSEFGGTECEASIADTPEHSGGARPRPGTSAQVEVASGSVVTRLCQQREPNSRYECFVLRDDV